MIEITYFVHATTTDNENKIASGWQNSKLSEKGKLRAKNLAKIIENESFSIVFCSDLFRAVESANIFFKDKNINIIQDKRLRECNYGNLNGKSASMVDYNAHIDIPFENGESLKDVKERIKDFINFLKQNYPNQKIAIVGHRATQLAFECLTKNISLKQAILNDWRNTNSWQPGWKYYID